LHGMPPGSEECQRFLSLCKEAANLIEFQQSYQAASKTMQIAQKLFDEVLAIAR